MSAPPAPATQRQIADFVWGKGFSAPGGAQRVIELVKPLGLSPAVSLLDLDAGTGGSASTIAAKFGAYVSAYASDPDHAKLAAELAVAHAVDNKISVRHMGASGLKLRPNYFQGAFVHDYMYLAPDKASLLREIARSVKPHGRVIIADLFGATDPPGPAARAWADDQDVPVFLCSAERLKADLAGGGLDVRICEDESELYCDLALRAWGESLRGADAGPPPPGLLKPLLEAAERWNGLLAAIRSGDVRCLKIEAVKRRS